MQLLENDTFLDSMREAGITVQSGWFRLSFGRYEETDRFWVWPWPPHDIIALFAAVLEYPTAAVYCDAWRPGGVWVEEDPSYTDSIREVLLRGHSIPPDFRGALRFDSSEVTSLIALFLAFATAGWNINDDLCVVPDHRQFLVRVSHHAVLHVECSTPELIEGLVAHMAERGWRLPTEVPDATFKIPSWMNVRDHETPT